MLGSRGKVKWSGVSKEGEVLDFGRAFILVDPSFKVVDDNNVWRGKLDQGN